MISNSLTRQPEWHPKGLSGRLERAALAVTRLDARLEASGLAAGWQARCDITEAARALLLDGQLVDLEDLVLHDAGMDVRHPTHELTRAAAALKARRTALARPAPWPLSIDGLTALRGIAPARGEGEAKPTPKKPDPEDEESYPPFANDADPLKAHLAEIDALLARTNQVLAGETPLPQRRSPLIYDSEEDETESEDLWLEELKRIADWPAVAAAAAAWDLWLKLNLGSRQPWLGLILAAAVLRSRGLTSRLLPLAGAFKQSGFRPRGRETPQEMIEGFCAVVEEAVAIGGRDLDRLVLARELMGRVTARARRHSHLPGLVDLFLSRPLVTVPLAAKVLGVTPKAVELMLRRLGGALPRELTGRARYRAWGIV